jgi:hypothetical protein
MTVPSRSNAATRADVVAVAVAVVVGARCTPCRQLRVGPRGGVSHLKGFFSSSAASSPAPRFSKIGKTGDEKRVKSANGRRSPTGSGRVMFENIFFRSDARLGGLVSGRVSPGWSLFRLTEEEDAAPDMLMMRRTECDCGLVMARVGTESIRVVRTLTVQRSITPGTKHKVKEYNVHMLQQHHRTTDKLQTSFIKLCPTTPVFLEIKHEIQMGEGCIFKRREGRITR